MPEKSVSQLIMDDFAKKLENDGLLKPIAAHLMDLFAGKYDEASITNVLATQNNEDTKT